MHEPRARPVVAKAACTRACAPSKAHAAIIYKLDPLHACLPVEHPGAVLHARVLLSFHAGCSC